jgi:UDP-N-acetylmuramoyl-tripeptide--D-alanyl-D-alanine ligase
MDKLLEIFLVSTGVSTDTRSIDQGNLFFALKGDYFNGNIYADKALELGADYVIIDEHHGQIDDRKIMVENVLTSLQELAKSYRTYLNIPVIALTGSNGKTTTKELLHIVLSKKFQLNATKGNLNNEIGVPLTILNTKKHHEILITEMGANHQGEIALLSSIAMPNFGVITNIGKAHLEGFGGVEGVKKGKTELYKYLTSTGGLTFINTADPTIMELAPKQNIYQYSSDDLTVTQDHPTLSLMHLPSGKSIRTKLAGTYNTSNIAAAFAFGQYFEIELDTIIEALESYTPANNRSQLDEYKGVKIIKDAYNANPSSLQSSLDSLFSKDPSDKIVILGDMLELGEYALAEHKNILEKIAKTDVFKAIFVGPIFYRLKDEYPNFEFYTYTLEAKEHIDWSKFIGKIVLLKGSRGIALEKLLD